MRLIIVHGPPAVGKYTISRELSRQTGYLLLHNHLFFDFASELFEPFSPQFCELLQDLRVTCATSLARAGKPGAIMTICYDHPDDLELISGIREAVEGMGGDVVAVQLVCETDELLKRVTHPDRHSFRKVTNEQKLLGTLERWNLFTPIPGLPSIRIDNTELSVESAVSRIVDFYELPVVSGTATPASSDTEGEPNG